METSRRFENRCESVRSARLFVAEQLADTDVDVFVAEVLTSEFATNAVEHGRRPFALYVHTDGDHARVEVVDDDSEMIPAMQRPDDRGRRSLRIVDSLARDWGAYSDRRAEVLWFEL